MSIQRNPWFKNPNNFTESSLTGRIGGLLREMREETLPARQSWSHGRVMINFGCLSLIYGMLSSWQDLCSPLKHNADIKTVIWILGRVFGKSEASTWICETTIWYWQWKVSTGNQVVCQDILQHGFHSVPIWLTEMQVCHECHEEHDLPGNTQLSVT